MKRMITVAALALAGLFFCANAFCQPATPADPAEAQEAMEPAPETMPAPMDDQVQVISVATEAVKGAGMSVEDVNIVYDQGGQLWSERIGQIKIKQPNKGILKKGNLNTDEVVYFDYKEPLKDVWIFVNRDTGEVVEIYREE